MNVVHVVVLLNTTFIPCPQFYKMYECAKALLSFHLPILPRFLVGHH